MPLSDLVSILALIIGLLALAIASWTLWVSRESRNISAEAFTLSDHSAQNEVIAHLRGWCDRVIAILAEAIDLIQRDSNSLGEANESYRSSLLTKLSGLIDQGRFHFPNSDQDIYGQHKHQPFRGFRSPVLDLLVISFALIDSRPSQDKEANELRLYALVHLKRTYIDAIYRVIEKAPYSSVLDLKKSIFTAKPEALSGELRPLIPDQSTSFEVTFDDHVALDRRYRR
ncbi:MAG: hypothetical protein M9913_08905 [Bryobacteraceae bacterium]|nr:hypothetical protein [Solibacteraceae bacterium]MCO5351004.1 hypothetical protein [Bryobacteraceae bacterium]